MVAASTTTNYEPATHAIALWLLEKMGENRSPLASLQLDDKLLAWAMNNSGLRVQLFRLIDCLPSLESRPEIATHVQEYLSDESVELPSSLKNLLNFTDPNSLAAQTAASTFRKGVAMLAQRYIAGETTEQILKTIERLRRNQMAFTIDLLGEAVISEAEAQSYQQRYLDLLATLSQAAQNWQSVPAIDTAEGEDLPKVQVSVKLTAFYSQFDPLDPESSREKVCERVRPLLRRAQELGAAIHFDMEQYVYKDLTLAILKDLLMEEEFRDRADIGVTLQAYLRDSQQDLEDLIAWAKQRGTPITIRLVKGAYWDQETIRATQHRWLSPVFPTKAETDCNFEQITQTLLTNHEWLHGAIGSHNVRSQALAIAIAEDLNIPRQRFELQVLYGMGDTLAKAMVKRGHRVRVYSPYGQLLPGMAYLIRRLLENTANSSFLRQKLENRPAEELLAPPSPKSEQAPTPNPGVFANAANTDYADQQQRENAQVALARVRQQFGKTYSPLINGELVETVTYQDSVNPSQPSERIGRVGQISLEQAEAAMQAAQAAFPAWKNTPISERARIIRQAADLMEQRRHEFNAWVCFESGKVLAQADPEVSEAIDFCRYYADAMAQLQQGHHFDLTGETNFYHYQPRGVAVIISPWNFPIAISTGMTVAALVTGNCALLKPAGTTSIVAAKLTEILIAAGIPKGVFQYVPGPGSTIGDYLVKHPQTHLIAFTGSREVGCQIYADAAVVQPKQRHLKRVIAEMGGKNAVIVDASADLDQAVSGIISSAFGYSGQKCSACSRAIVLESVYDRFVERLMAATRSLQVGKADDPATKVGPVINETARDRVCHYINQGKQEANLALQVSVPEDGYYVAPTIFTEVPPHAVIAQAEIFGPVIAVIKVKDFAEALAVANDTDYALTGGIYSRTLSHIEQAKAQFEVGNFYINRGITGSIVARQPFGGFKLSGIGSKAGGPDYLVQFMEPRVITENIQRQGFAPITGAD